MDSKNFRSNRKPLLVLILGALSLTFSLSAGAASSKAKSVLFYQPDGGQLAVTLLGNSISIPIDVKQSDVKVAEQKTTKSAVGASVEYGINDMLSVGIAADSGTNETKTTIITPASESTTKETGMSDITVGANVNGDSGMMFLRGSLSADISSGTKKSASTTKDGTRGSGGNSITLGLGVGAKMGSMTLGVSGEYINKMDRKTESASGSESTTTGGNTTTVGPFIEMDFGMLGLALSGGSYSEANSKVKSASGTETESEGMKGTYAGVDLAINATSNLSILAGYKILMIKDYLGDPTYDKMTFNISTMNAGLRFAF